MFLWGVVQRVVVAVYLLYFYHRSAIDTEYVFIQPLHAGVLIKSTHEIVTILKQFFKHLYCSGDMFILYSSNLP